MNRPPKPTEAELEILHVLWQQGPCTVRTVNETLAHKRRIGYTTTLKIMQIMHEKGMLARRQAGRGHVYAAVYREQETQRVLLERFLDATFGGSALKLVMQALGNRKTSKEELGEIKAYLSRLENKEGERS